MLRGLLFFLMPLVCAAQSSIAPEDLCSIEGQVFDSATGGPLRKATLILRRMDLAPADNYSTVSDAAGMSKLF